MSRPIKPPSYCLHKGSGQAVVRVNGRDVYLGKYDTPESHTEYRRVVAEWLASGGSDPLPVVTPLGITVAEAIDRYWRHAQDYYRNDDGPLVGQLYRVKLGLAAVRDLYGKQPAATFGPRGLKAVRQALLDRPGKPLSRNYVNSAVGCIQTAWTWLASEEIVPAEQAMALRTVLSLRTGKGGRETEQIVGVAPELVQATLPHTSHVVRAMVQVQQFTGMRPGEVIRMRRCDLSCRAEERIEVPGTKPRQVVSAIEVAGRLIWLYVPESHKTIGKGKRRLIPLGPQTQAVLAPFLEGRDREAFLFSPTEAMRGRIRKANGRYSTQSYGKALIYATRKGKLPHWAPNQLRHAAATVSDEQADRDTTAALLGHSTPDMAAVYADKAFRRAAAFVAEHG